MRDAERCFENELTATETLHSTYYSYKKHPMVIKM